MRARLPYALGARGEETHESRRGDDRRDEGHENAYAEDLLRKVSARKAEARDYERDLAARNHPGADPEATEHVEAAAHRRHHAAQDLGRHGEQGVDAAEDEDRL